MNFSQRYLQLVQKKSHTFNEYKEKLFLNILEDKVHRSLTTIYTILNMTVELHRFDRTAHKKACNIIILSRHA